MLKNKLTSEENNRLLNKYKSNKSLIKFFRKFKKTSENIYGYIVENKSPFLLIHKNEEFNLNGFSIIRKDQVDSIRYDKFEKTIENILLKEEISNQDLTPKFELDLTSWESIFSSLKKADRHVIIEYESKGYFFIGRIEKVNKKSLELRYYDASGLWEKETTKIKYKKITIVKFEDRYIEVFRKYLRWEGTKVEV